MKRCSITFAMTVTVAAGVFSASGATNYWDNNGADAGFGAAGGIWGADGNWSSDSTGATLPNVTNTAAGDALYFGTDTDGLAAGTITVDSTNQSFSTMTFGAASGEITLSGGTLSLASPASRITVQNSSATLAAALAGTNGLHKYQADTLLSTNFLTATSSVIFSNASLAAYVSAGTIVHGGWIVKSPAAAYHFSNSGTAATWQSQILDGGFTKCVKVELTQAGADIAARAVYAKYITGSQLGFDFDTGGSVGTIAESASANGYGVAQTVLLSAAVLGYEPFLTATPVTIATNALLSDFAYATASMAGGSVSDGPVATTPLYFSSNGSTSTVQMQAFNGAYTKCVKVELAQAGNDITARALYARYYNSQNNNHLGLDFDAPGVTANSLATAFNGAGYGLCQLRLTAGTLRLTVPSSYTGATTISSGRLEIAGDGTLGDGVYTGAIVNAGQLLYSSAAEQLLSGPLSGSGALVKESSGKSEISLSDSSTLTDTFRALFFNCQLADCSGAQGILGGPSINGGTPMAAAAYFFLNDGTNATFQLQVYEGGHTKCVKVAMTQSGQDIAVRAVYAKYLLSQNALGFNFDTGGTSGGYIVVGTTIHLFRHSRLTLSGAASYSGGTTVNSGTLIASGTAAALPSTAGIVVNAPGELLLNVTGMNVANPGGVGNGNRITVKGGLLTLAKNFNAGYSRPLVIDGGTLTCTFFENNDGANYINNLTLLNGAQVTGYKIRVGYHSAASIVVSGTSASSIPAGINMVKTGTSPLTFNVADVTGDAAPDLTVPGVIRDYDSGGFANMPIIKTGAGTLHLSGANTHVGLITVNAGTLALGANSTLNSGNPLVLNGGTLALDGFTNTVGTLSVSGSGSTLALGTGTIAFADSSAALWSGTLTLTGTLGAQSVRFGTSAAALTGAQINAITINGERAALSSNGYLKLAPSGTIIIVN